MDKNLLYISLTKFRRKRTFLLSQLKRKHKNLISEFKNSFYIAFAVIFSIVTRNGQPGNTGRLNRNLYVMLKFTKGPRTPGMTSKKTLLSLKGISSFAGDFVVIWVKQRLIWFNLQRDGTRNALSNNSKKTFAENLQLQMSVQHQSMSIFQGWSLKFV